MSICPHCQQVLTSREISSGKCPLCAGVWEAPVVAAEVVSAPKARRDSPPPVAITLARASVVIPLLMWIFACCALWQFGGVSAGGGAEAFPLLVMGVLGALAGCLCGIIAMVDAIRYSHAKLFVYAALGLILSGLNLLPWLASLIWFAAASR